MKVKNKIILNLIFIFTIIFASTASAIDNQQLPKENVYHEINIVDANINSFGIKINNINQKKLENISLHSIKENGGRLEIHSQGVNDLKANQEIELNGKYLSSVDKNKEQEIDEILESKEKEIIEKDTTKSINWFLIALLSGLSLGAIVFVFLYKKMSKLFRGIISIAAIALIALSIFLALPSKNYAIKFDKIKYSYTDKEGKTNKFYGLLSYNIEESDSEHNKNKVEYFENSIAMEEEVEIKKEDIDFETNEETSNQMDVVVKDENGEYKLNKKITEGEKGEKTFEELYLKIKRDNKLISRDKKSEKLIDERKAKDKVVITGIKPVKLKENIDFKKVFKSDITAEVGSSKVDETVKPKNGQKIVVYTYNTETGKIEKNESIDNPTNEVILVGVIKYVKEEVDFKEEIIKRDDLPETHKKVIQEGQVGKITKKYRLAFNEETGSVVEEIGKGTLLNTDTQKPINQIVEIGTKPVEVLNEFGLTKAEENYLTDFENRFSASSRKLLNNLRSRNKLNELNQNSVLDKVAQKRNLDNINNNKFAHEYTKNGVYYSAKQDASNLGYAYSNTVGENISITEFRVYELKEIEEILGKPEFYAEEIIHNYYEDPGDENLSKGHRKAMLSPIWSEAGFDLKIRAVKQRDGSYKVKVHGAQIFGVGRVLETQEDVDMFNYFRSNYQTDTKYFVPTRGLSSYESYLQRDNLMQYFSDSASAKAFREKSIAENEAFKKAISSGEANLSELKNYEEHKNFFENMKANDKVYN